MFQIVILKLDNNRIAVRMVTHCGEPLWYRSCGTDTVVIDPVVTVARVRSPGVTLHVVKTLR